MIEEKERMENKRERNNSDLRSGRASNGSKGGNGIAGLVLLGGALAIAGFMALASFITHKNKTKGALTQPNPKPNPQQVSFETQSKSQDLHQIEADEALHSQLQQSTTPTNHIDVTCDETSHTTSITEINPSNFLHAETSILEVPHLNCNTELVYPTHLHHQEIVSSNDSQPETVALSNDISGSEEECSASLCNSHGSQAHMQPQDSLKSIESIEKETQDDVVLESGEEEDIIPKEILNSKEEPVWPAEKDFMGEAKTDSNADGSHSSATNEDVIVTPEVTLIEKANISVQLNHLPLELHSCELTTWLMARLLLVFLLLLVLLINPYYRPFSEIPPMK